VVPEEEYYESDYEVTDGAQKDFKTVRDDVNYSESAIEENPVYPDEEILYEGPAGESEMDEF